MSRAWVLLSFLVASASSAEAQDAQRKTQDADLALPATRQVLNNGLVVIAAPDLRADGVWVHMIFRAGALYEPPGRSGLAHLAEHLLATGSSSDTDYARAAEARGSWYFNATTSAETMSFELGLPADELPFGLWMMADRVGRGAEGFEPEVFRREREVVEVERALVHLDRPYARPDLAIQRRVFGPDHPLTGGVIGHPEHLESAELEDVRDFVESRIRASNAVLIVSGRFEPEGLPALLETTVARLPRREVPPAAPREPSAWQPKGALALDERWSRQPRVSLVWKMPRPNRVTLDILELSAVLLGGFVDGAFGSRVHAGVLRAGADVIFRLDVVLPYDKPVRAAQGEAEVFLRYLTAVDMPTHYYDAVRQRIDLELMFALDSLPQRGRLLWAAERQGQPPEALPAVLTRHWRWHRHDVQHTAWKTLIQSVPRLTFHARPTRPRQPKLSWEDRNP
ncbi:MAG: insulinase family protein [Myxococcota bacterium]